MDIIATSEDPEKIISEFCLQPDIDRILGKGPTKCSIVLTSGVQVDLRVVDKDQVLGSPCVFHRFQNPQHRFTAPGA